MGRAPCCDKANVKKGPWSPKEDSELKEYIAKYGTGGNWIALPQKIGLKRCGKSCRLRWLNYLRPNIKHGGFSEEEDNIICSFYNRIGSRWSIIAAHLPGRTDNDIKNYWNTMLKKKLAGKGKDYQARHLGAAKQQSQDLQSYDTSEVNTSPNIYGPQQQPVGVVHHMNINCMNGPYSNLGHRIIYQLFDKNCGSTISESSSSTEPATFQLNHQEVIDQEVSGCNTCVRNPHQGLERTPVDNPSNDWMTVMISTSPPVHASSSMNTSEMMQSIAYNQYSSDAASQISYETAASSVLMDARRMENHSKLENPSAAFAQNDNLLFFSASSSPGEENYESAWMKTISPENNNLGATVFSAEWSDLLLYSNISPGLQREACNYACDSINIY